MADEQASVEITTPEELVQEEIQDTDSTVEVETPSTPEVSEEPDRGDLRIPLQEERRKRQAYEQELARFNDPAFIYEQAVKLGLAEGTYTPPAQETEVAQGHDIASQVQFQLQIERAKEKYPDVTSDPVLADATWALIQKGHSPMEAADIVQKNLDKRLDKLTEERIKSRMQATTEAESAKRAAELADTGTSSSDADYESNLIAQSKNWKDPKTQEKAQLELLKMRMK